MLRWTPPIWPRRGQHMKSTLVSIVGLTLVIGGCTSPPRELSDRHAQAMQDSVATMLSAYRSHYAARAWDSLAGFYLDGPGFRWVEDGVVRYRSLADVRQAWDRLPPAMELETTYHDTEIHPVAPGLATVITGFDTRLTDSAGTGFTFGGAVTMTVSHRVDGWRILGGHTSTERARPSQ